MGLPCYDLLNAFFGDVSPLHAAVGMGVTAVLASLKNYVFEQRPIKLILINESYKLVCYLVVGIIALFA